MRQGKRYRLLSYGIAVFTSLLALLLSLLLSPLLEQSTFALFFAAVAFSSWHGGRGPGLLATLLCSLAMASDYFFLLPTYSLSAVTLDGILQLSLFVGVSLLTNELNAVRQREQLQSYAAELEQRVAKCTAALQEANAEMEAFTYSVSHDLREPLRVLQGFAQILLEDYAEQLDPVGQNFTQRILTTAQRMEALLRDLLSYSHLNRIELLLQPISLTSVVREALTQLDYQIQEPQAQVTVEEPLLPVVGQYIVLVQVVTNLLTNAIKFVAPRVQPQVRIWTEKRNQWVRLWLEDNGIGVEPKHQERIFKVFERLHAAETYPGTGIGLALVRRGVERMGGTVGIESEVGRGSRFWIELPAVEESK